VSPAAPRTGQPVRFSSTSSDPDGEALTASWDFDGDGVADATGNVVTHVFTAAGPVTVRLTVTDTPGASASTTATFTVTDPPPPVPNVAPTAAFTFAPSAPGVGQAVQFVSTSSDSDGRIVTQTWDLDGDGRFGDAFTPVAQHTYTAPGVVVVRLRVVDDRGASATATAFLSVVADKPPIAAFTFAPGAPVAGQPVTFSSQSSDPDGAIVAQAWDLDGNGLFDDASGGTAVKVFPAAGQHMVSLRVTDDRGVSSVAFQSVFVGGAAPSPGPAAPPGSSAPGPHPPGSSPSPGALLLSPFPIVHIRGRIFGSTVKIDLLSVRAPRGALVRVRCRGGGCPRRSAVVRTVSAVRPVRLGRFERRYRPGAVLEVFVTERGRIGKYVRFTMRRGLAPAREDLCVVPGGGRPSRCPGA
jgi:PKD repeat protein